MKTLRFALCVLAAGSGAALAARALQPAAAADVVKVMELTCGVAQGATGGPAGAFVATVPFGDGSYVALSDPETGKVDKLLYDAEVLNGKLMRGAGSAERIVWTKATSRKARLVGHVYLSNGEVLTLTVSAASDAAGQAARPFALFSSSDEAVSRGTCLPSG